MNYYSISHFISKKWSSPLNVWVFDLDLTQGYPTKFYYKEVWWVRDLRAVKDVVSLQKLYLAVIGVGRARGRLSGK